MMGQCKRCLREDKSKKQYRSQTYFPIGLSSSYRINEVVTQTLICKKNVLTWPNAGMVSNSYTSADLPDRSKKYFKFQLKFEMYKGKRVLVKSE